MNDCFDNTKFKLEIVLFDTTRIEFQYFNRDAILIRLNKERKKEKRIERLIGEIFRKLSRYNIRARRSKPNSKIGAKYSPNRDQRGKKKKKINGRIYI